VLHYGPREMLGHAARVAAIALAALSRPGADPEAQRTLGRAAFFHDVGLLYLAPEHGEETPSASLAQARVHRRHPVLGAQVAVELARTGVATGNLIALSHERSDGSGYPRALAGAALPPAAQALIFAEAGARFVGAQPDALRRFALSARIVPHEFPAPLVDWVVGCARARPIAKAPPAEGLADTGGALRTLHERIARLYVLFALPVGEPEAVRKQAALWLETVRALVGSLRRVGAEELFFEGAAAGPAADDERLELKALAEELADRLDGLRLQLEATQGEGPEFEGSSLLTQALAILAPA